MNYSEIIVEIAKQLNIAISTSMTVKYSYYNYTFHGPLIVPAFINRPNYSFIMPFIVTTDKSKLYIIDFSKIQNELESVITSYYFTLINARDVLVSVLSSIYEKDALFEITSKSLTPSHINVLKQNLTIMNQLVVKLVENELIEVINNN